MGGKKFDTSRRSFLRRAGMVLSAVGVSAGVKSGLLDSIARKAKKDFGTAHAAASDIKFHIIDMAHRAGADPRSLFLAKSYKQTPMANWVSALNCVYSNAEIGEYPAYNGQNLYLAEVDGRGGIGVANPLGAHADNIMFSLSLQGDGGHRSGWTVRGSNNGGVALGKANAMLNQGITAVDLARWNPNVNVNNPGNITSSDVGEADEFVSLYKDTATYMTRSELKLLVGSFELNTSNLVGDGALQKLDAIWRDARPIAGQDDVFKIGHAGRAQSLFSINLDPNAAPAEVYEPLDMSGTPIANTELLLDFEYGNTNFRAGGVHVGEMAYHAYRAFAHPSMLLNSMIVQANTQDWHGQNSFGAAGSRQALWATLWTRMIDSYAKYAKVTPDTLNDPTGELGYTLWDTSLIVMSSEFARSTRWSGDNGDTTPGWVMVAGGAVKGRTVGDTYVADGGGYGGGYSNDRVMGFNGTDLDTPVEGAGRMDDADVYASIVTAINGSPYMGNAMYTDAMFDLSIFG